MSSKIHVVLNPLLMYTPMTFPFHPILSANVDLIHENCNYFVFGHAVADHFGLLISHRNWRNRSLRHQTVK